MEEEIVKRERIKNAERRPAVQDASVMTLKE